MTQSPRRVWWGPPHLPPSPPAPSAPVFLGRSWEAGDNPILLPVSPEGLSKNSAGLSSSQIPISVCWINGGTEDRWTLRDAFRASKKGEGLWRPHTNQGPKWGGFRLLLTPKLSGTVERWYNGRRPPVCPRRRRGRAEPAFQGFRHLDRPDVPVGCPLSSLGAPLLFPPVSINHPTVPR